MHLYILICSSHKATKWLQKTWRNITRWRVSVNLEDWICSSGRKIQKLKRVTVGIILNVCHESYSFFIRSATECISNLKNPNTGIETLKERSFTVLWGALWSSSRKDKKLKRPEIWQYINEFSWPFWAKFSLSERAVREEEMKWAIPLYLSSPGPLRLRYKRGRCTFNSQKSLSCSFSAVF